MLPWVRVRATTRAPRGGVGVSRQMSFCTFRVRVCVYARLGYRYASGLGPPSADGLQGQRSHRVHSGCNRRSSMLDPFQCVLNPLFSDFLRMVLLPVERSASAATLGSSASDSLPTLDNLQRRAKPRRDPAARWVQPHSALPALPQPATTLSAVSINGGAAFARFVSEALISDAAEALELAVRMAPSQHHLCCPQNSPYVRVTGRTRSHGIRFTEPFLASTSKLRTL